MPYIHFRTHRLDLWEAMGTFLLQNGSNILSIKEIDAERPHIHTVLLFDKTKSTFWQRLKKKFPDLDGNKDFSISEVKDTPQDLQNILQYICKGETIESVVVEANNTSSAITTKLPDVILHHPKEHYDIMKLCNDYWIKNAELKASNIKVQVDKTQKEKKMSFTEECILQLRKQSPKYKWSMSPNDMKSVFQVVIMKLGEKSKVFDRSIIRRLVFGVLNVLCPSESSDYHFSKSFSSEDFY